MALAHATTNSDKVYPCVHCGSQQMNIIREGKTLEETRVKCQQCNGLYNASDSLAALDAGALPDAPPQLQDPDPEPAVLERAPILPVETQQVSVKQKGRIPRTPTHVLVAKDRSRAEFHNGKSLKKAVLQWESEGKKFDCFELLPKQAAAKVEIT